MVKPIEPGCLALVINCRHAGDIVTVVRRLKSGDLCIDKQGNVAGINRANDAWEVETAEHRGLFQEKNLLRIDGFDEPQRDDAEIVDRLAWQSF